jgi:hypothetical protein
MSRVNVSSILSVIIMVGRLRSQKYGFNPIPKPLSMASSMVVKNRRAAKAALEQRIRRLEEDADDARAICFNKFMALQVAYADPQELIDAKTNYATAVELRDITLRDIDDDKKELRIKIQAIDKELKRLEKQCYVRM